MDIRKLQRAIVDGLEDVKAHHIVVFNTEHLSPLFERVIVASGNSNRQTKALANSVRESVKSRGLPILSVEGADNGEWIVVDCGAAVAHIMQPAIREYYRLEEIWGGKAVKMKMDGEAGPEPTKPLPPSRAAARRAAPPRGDGAKAGTGKKAPSKKPAPGNAVAAKRGAPGKRSSGPKKAVASRKKVAGTPARKAAPKRAPRAR
ncbi:MAG TPA: ribosome silencing factor [Burkholderiaceae bacterium]